MRLEVKRERENSILGKRKVAKKSRVLNTHFAQSANFSRDYPATSLSLLEKISEGREAKRGRKYLR